MTKTPSFRSTITQALADTVMDESARGAGSVRATGDGTSLPDVGDLVGGLYRLMRVIGKGAFGKVYLAERIDVPEHQVALKVMPREMYSGRNVERELVMLAAAGHPNIVQLKDHGATPSYVWFTMPVYEGETLGSRLTRGTLSLREAYEIFLPIARGIEALHRSGLRHQDLKPENIYLAQFAGRLHPIILDLGVAAERSASFVAGTVLYASPEQIKALTTDEGEDRPPLNEKMDTYCLAATLLLSLVGAQLFPGSNAGTYDEMSGCQKQRADQPLHADALPELTGEPRTLLESALGRWFEIDAEQRSSITEMAEQLDVLLEKERAEARAEQRRIARQKAKLQRSRIAVGALVLGALGLLAVAYSKRETLRLANELAQARADEAASFDKLETCVAAHRMTKDDTRRCREQAERERTDFSKTLEEMTHDGNQSQAQCASQVLTFNARLRTCEDDAIAAQRQCAADKEKATSEADQRERQCRAEHERCTQESSATAATMTELLAQLDQCRMRPTPATRPTSDDNPYVEPPAGPPAGTPANPTPAGTPAPPPPAPVNPGSAGPAPAPPPPAVPSPPASGASSPLPSPVQPADQPYD